MIKDWHKDDSWFVRAWIHIKEFFGYIDADYFGILLMTGRLHGLESAQYINRMIAEYKAEHPDGVPKEDMEICMEKTRHFMEAIQGTGTTMEKAERGFSEIAKAFNNTGGQQ